MIQAQVLLFGKSRNRRVNKAEASSALRRENAIGLGRVDLGCLRLGGGQGLLPTGLHRLDQPATGADIT